MKNNFFRLIREPFKVISKNKSDYTIWFLFTIIAGQFGILANFIVRYFTYNIDFKSSLLTESKSGNFYTFAIALIASILGPIFINIIKTKSVEFRTLKIFTIAFSVIFLFISGVIYSSIQASNNPVKLLNVYTKLDITQTLIYLFAILFATYGYCVMGLENNKKDFEFINDPIFYEEDNKEVEAKISKSDDITNDNKGIEL